MFTQYVTVSSYLVGTSVRGCRLDRVFCPKICLFKTDGWHFGQYIHPLNIG